VDIALFTQWVDAYLNDDADVAAFYQRRFRDEFEPAFRAWLATDPFSHSSAPDSPFAMSEYRLEATDHAAALETTANATAELARQDVQRATNYVLGVVLFAVSLFFAAISTKLTRPRLQKLILGVGAAVFLLAAGWIATFPVSISI
jgi:hypothetical protein